MLVVVAIGVAGGSRANAAPDDALKRARELFEQGLRLEDESRFREALEAFRKVAAVKVTPQIRYHLGVCLAETGRLREAAKELALAEELAAESKAEDSEVVRGSASRRRAEIAKRLSHLSVEVSAEGDRVTVDDEAWPAKIEAPIEPGKHLIRIARGDSIRLAREISLREGEHFVMREDDEATTTTTTTRRRIGWWTFATGGAALGSFAAAGVFAFLRSSAISDLESRCPDRSKCPPEAQGRIDDASSYTSLSNVFLVGGGVLALATVGLYVFAPDTRTTVTASPGGLRIAF